MKKFSFKVAALLLAGTMLTTSCIGSFSLFNKYESWQRNMTDNKFVNAVVGFVLMVPVGSVCLFVDSLVLNSIEFWSGENPVSANVGKSQTIKGKDGRYYAVKTLENGYEVKAPDGEVTLFIHHSEDDSWSMTRNGMEKEIFHFDAEGNIHPHFKALAQE